jgi:hypothetical protein
MYCLDEIITEAIHVCTIFGQNERRYACKSCNDLYLDIEIVHIERLVCSYYAKRGAVGFLYDDDMSMKSAKCDERTIKDYLQILIKRLEEKIACK